MKGLQYFVFVTIVPNDGNLGDCVQGSVVRAHIVLLSKHESAGRSEGKYAREAERHHQ